MNLRFPVIVAVVTVAAATAAYRGFVHVPDPLPSAAPAGDLAFASPAPARESPVERHGLRTLTVYVAGAVARAGVYALPATSRANDAVRAAGGASGDADLVAVNLAEPLSDGEEIVVPVKGGTDSAEAQPSTDGARAGGRVHRASHRKRRKHHKRRSAEAAVTSEGSDGASSSPDPTVAAEGPSQIVDINAADANELETLPGIGPSLASRIVTFREINGPFSSADDLLDVNGMTQGRVDAISPYVATK
jgi:competence ComEA-like helix-hairpin-helix protein